MIDYVIGIYCSGAVKGNGVITYKSDSRENSKENNSSQIIKQQLLMLCTCWQKGKKKKLSMR